MGEVIPLTKALLEHHRRREPRFGPLRLGDETGYFTEGYTSDNLKAPKGHKSLRDILRHEPDEADWNNDDPGAA